MLDALPPEKMQALASLLEDYMASSSRYDTPYSSRGRSSKNAPSQARTSFF
jgi:hypothetical protein